VPELPEIAAHAERLDDDYRQTPISRFTPLHLTALKTFDPAPDSVAGAKVTGVGHRGKHIVMRVEGDVAFVIHLMQGGRLRPDVKKSRKPRGGMARWEFADDRALLLTEAGTERKAGVWLVGGDPDASPPLDKLGPDADTVGRAELGVILGAQKGRIHGVLRDQRVLAGIGRMLVNEILHTARLSPFATAPSLDDEQLDRLHAAMTDRIGAALAHERTLDDIGKSVDRPNRVHHRFGFACAVCDDEIRSVEYKRYTVAYCPTCQTGGKVLADNTTSKFLK